MENRAQLPGSPFNSRWTLTFVHQWQNNSTGEIVLIGSPEGRPGAYKVDFVLSRPGERTHVEDLSLSKLVDSGSTSLLGNSDVDISVNESTTVSFRRNGRGEYASASVSVDAANFQEAEAKAHDLVMTILSQLSFLNEVPIDVLGYQLTEQATQTFRCSYKVLGKRRTVDWTALPDQSLKSIRPLLSAYREGMNSTNPFYQTLCFYKVIEGIRVLRRAEARKVVGFQSVFEERVPASLDDLQWGDEFTSGCLKPYLGQRFTKVIDQLRGQARNAVAHLDPDNETHVQADLFESRDRCEAAAIVLNFIAHRMLHNEIPAQEALAVV